MTLVGVIFTFAGLWATYTYGIPRKTISCDVESITPLLSAKAKDETELKVTFLGKEMPEIHLAELTFTNTGNREILPSEFIEAITIGVGPNTRF